MVYRMTQGIELDYLVDLQKVAVGKRILATVGLHNARLADKNGRPEVAGLANNFALDMTVDAKTLENLVAEFSGQTYIGFCESFRRQLLWGG